jgi:hypothetical protein
MSVKSRTAKINPSTASAFETDISIPSLRLRDSQSEAADDTAQPLADRNVTANELIFWLKSQIVGYVSIDALTELGK